MNQSRSFEKQNTFPLKVVSIRSCGNFRLAGKVRLNRILPGFLLVFVFLLTGCGGGIPRCEVEGTITVDGQPVKEGSITFQPLEGTSGPVAGASIIDGHYNIEKAKGPVVGEYQIVLTGRAPTGKKVVTEAAGDKIETEVMKNIIPLKHQYQDETISKNPKIGKEPLKATVVSGKNVIDFKMTND